MPYEPSMTCWPPSGPEVVKRIKDGVESLRIRGLEVKNPNLITVLWSCGHIAVHLRPAGITDPMNCLCFSCHPEPIAYREWLCPDCSTAKIKERYQERN